MDDNQRELRRTAAQEFLKALEELEGILQAEDSQPVESASIANTESTSDALAMEDLPECDLAAWEEAVADIEQFMQDKADG